MYSKQRGFLSIETMVVLALLGILFSVAAKGLSDSVDDTKPTEVQRELSTLTAKAAKCGVINGGSFAKCTIPYLVSMGELEEETWGEDGKGVNPYNGDYTLSVDTGNTNRFVMTATNIVNAKHCKQLLEMYTDKSKSVTCESSVLTVVQGS